MINKKLDDINLSDIESLITNNVIEHKTLEYKSQLPSEKYDEKKEFLADVSSFANTHGGDLIFGIKESKGVLDSDLGFASDDVDAAISRLHNMIRDGIAPRFTPDIKSVDVGNSKVIIIMRVQASLDSPHRVTLGGHDKFYTRNSNGKSPMDVFELRNSFAQTGAIVERIKSFRNNKISDIKTGNAQFPLPEGKAFLTLHFIPLSAFNGTFKINSNQLRELAGGRYGNYFSPFPAGNWGHRINLNGIAVFQTQRTNNGEIVSSYAQLYRNGIIEVVNKNLLSQGSEAPKLRMDWFEGKIMKYASQCLQLLSALDLQPPVYIFLSFVGIKGFGIATEAYYSNPTSITVEDFLLPEIVIDNFSDNIEHKFRAIFDIVWNAAGFLQSANFDENDNFVPQ